MDDGLTAAFDSHTQLEGGEKGDGTKAGGRGQALGGEPAQDFSNGNEAMITTLLVRGKEGGAAAVGEDR